MSVGNVVVSQDAPAKNNLWIQPKGTARFWNGSIWKTISGSGGGGGDIDLEDYLQKTEAQSLYLPLNNITGIDGYAAKFSGSKTITSATDSIRVGDAVIEWDSEAKGLHIYNANDEDIAGMYADWVSALGVSGPDSGGGGGGGLSIDELWKELTDDQYWISGDDKIINDIFIPSNIVRNSTLLNNYYDRVSSDSRYVKHNWFSKLFEVYDNSTNPPTLIEVNEDFTPNENFSIKAKMGLWTEQFISALGLDPSSGGGGGSGGGGMDINALWNALTVWDENNAHIINGNYLDLHLIDIPVIPLGGNDVSGVLPISKGGTGNTTGTAVNSVNDEYGNNIYDNYEKEYIYVADLSSLNTATWYPVCIPMQNSGMRKISCVNRLDGSPVPSWATHSAGFTAIVELLIQPSAWGAATPNTILLQNNQTFYSGNPPVGYKQINEYSIACFYCRGGGKYRLKTDFIGTWTIYTSEYTFNSQYNVKVAPTTTYPGFNFSPSTISANLSGNASTTTTLQTSRTIWGQSFNGSSNIDGLLKIQANATNYCEGIRIKPYNSWSTILLGGNDLSADTGTSANSWAIVNNNGTLYINKNASSGAGNPRAMATSTGWTFGNTSLNSYALNAASFICADWVRTSGNTGWYNESYGGGMYMIDATYVRVYNNKRLYSSNAERWSIHAAGGFASAVGVPEVFNTYYNGTWYGTIYSHNNGNISINSCSGGLYIGYYNTNLIDFLNAKARLDSSGNFYATGGVTALATISSDKRLKKNIKPFNATEIVNKLKPVQFEWNNKAKKYNKNFKEGTNYGLIAQDSDGIIDNLVFDLPDGKGYKGVRYEKLIPILLQAIKEQSEKIENLEYEINVLKGYYK